MRLPGDDHGRERRLRCRRGRGAALRTKPGRSSSDAVGVELVRTAVEATSTVPRSPSAGCAGRGAGDKEGQRHGDEAVRVRLADARHRRRRLARRAARSPTWTRAAFQRRWAPGFPTRSRAALPVSPPEDEEERGKRGGGEIRREGDSPAPLTADHGRPGAEAPANVLASLDDARLRRRRFHPQPARGARGRNEPTGRADNRARACRP